MEEKLLHIYTKLFERFGPQHWWPAKTPFEVIVGAVLTQAVAWRNVVKAITNLETGNLLSPFGIYQADPMVLMEFLKPTRYYKMKTKKLGGSLAVSVSWKVKFPMKNSGNSFRKICRSRWSFIMNFMP